MAKTSAERQAAYRARQAEQGSGERRINTWVSAETYLTLEGLAESYGVTRRAVIELLVSQEAGKPLLKERSDISKSMPSKKLDSEKLLRNELQEATSKINKQKKRGSVKLLRNDGPAGNDQKPEKQPDHGPEPKSPQPVGDQFGFEF